MGTPNELKWSETKSSDGTTKIGHDETGEKRREEYHANDGSRRIWISNEKGLLSSFQEFSANGLLSTERIYA